MSSGMRILEEEIDRYLINKPIQIKSKPITVKYILQDKHLETEKVNFSKCLKKIEI